jgi:hypothetical protein
LNVTVLDPCVPPKFVPVIVTDVPTGPEVTFRLPMFGAEPGFVTWSAPPAQLSSMVAKIKQKETLITSLRTLDLLENTVTERLPRVEHGTREDRKRNCQLKQG